MREGDRSEYFAQVLLSGLGLSTPIPRTEDIGFDFLCSISDQENGILTFGSPYLLSVKSISAPNIILEPTEAAKKRNSQDHIEWLFKQELPIFLGVVDKDNFRMSIFSLIPIWFLYYDGGPKCGALTIKPRLDPNRLEDVGRPSEGLAVTGWPGKISYEVDVGHPIAIIDLDTLKDPQKLIAAKSQLRRAIHYAQLNEVHQHLKIPHFHWFAKTSPAGKAFTPAFYYLPVPPSYEARMDIMKELAPSLISFALHFKGAEDYESLRAVCRLLNHAPKNFIPDEIRQALPELDET